MSEATAPIKVVDIINDRELAVNAGTDRGLEPGTVLKIVTSEPRQIVDPETQEVLGEIVETKAVVRVFEAQSKFALARTFRTRSVNVGGTGIGTVTAMAKVFSPPKYETRIETLKRDTSGGEPLAPEESSVQVGDLVELVDGDDVDDIPSSSLWR